MNKWILEDWAFTVEVVDGDAKNCRLGLETGDTFFFEQETPQGFCPRAFSEISTWCEVIRCGGDFTYRGAKEKYGMEIPCHCLQFRLTVTPRNSDADSNHVDDSASPKG